jgi:hypothetical protein
VSNCRGFSCRQTNNLPSCRMFVVPASTTPCSTQASSCVSRLLAANHPPTHLPTRSHALRFAVLCYPLPAQVTGTQHSAAQPQQRAQAKASSSGSTAPSFPPPPPAAAAAGATKRTQQKYAPKQPHCCRESRQQTGVVISSSCCLSVMHLSYPHSMTNSSTLLWSQCCHQ